VFGYSFAYGMVHPIMSGSLTTIADYNKSREVVELKERVLKRMNLQKTQNRLLLKIKIKS